MKVQIEVGKGIQCDGIEIMFGDSISFVVELMVKLTDMKIIIIFMSHHFWYMWILIIVLMK